MSPIIAKREKSSDEALALKRLRHSASHVMAEAVLELFPGAKLAIGPATDEGFYYDFETPHAFTDDDLAKIEARMREIIKGNARFVRSVRSRDEAAQYLAGRGEHLKVELLADIPGGEEISFYESGAFVDLCEGPHVSATGEIKHFKLLKVSGAYWRGSEKNQMLQRIYGTAFPTKDELDTYLKNLEEAERRDHRRLGPSLGLFQMFEEAGPGLVFYEPKGAVLYQEIVKWSAGLHAERGYEPLITPHILKTDMWETSGHMTNYRDNMFMVSSLLEMESAASQSEGKRDFGAYGIKPMNCPGHILVYASRKRSYRELPIRYWEFGTVYRYERAGVLHGLLRVRAFTQDDAHIFCTPEQYEEEIGGVFDFCCAAYDTFGFNYTVGLKTKPDKAIGGDELWEMAEGGLEKVLKARGVPYYILPKDGTFYGPKIDFTIKDSLGRDWQGSTIQLDFNLPQRFDLTYVGADGADHQPVMIHRAVLGSFERFIGLLIEEFGGAFPLWVAPVQIAVLPITDKQLDYAMGVADELKAKGLRVYLDARNEKLGYKVREATVAKIPYQAVVGGKEAEAGTVSLRSYFNGDMGAKSVAEVSAHLLDEVATKKFFKK
jgi:threonyl-tRNA synthetase